MCGSVFSALPNEVLILLIAIIVDKAAWFSPKRQDLLMGKSDLVSILGFVGDCPPSAGRRLSLIRRRS